MTPASRDWDALYARFKETSKDRLKAQARQMRKDGLSYREIGRRLNTPYQTVFAWLNGGWK